MVLKFLTGIIMMCGLAGTFFPYFPGTVLIFLAGFFYELFTGFQTYQLSVALILVFLTIFAEFGAKIIRRYTTRAFPVSRSFSTDTTAGNIAGIIIADALLGSIMGSILWEVIVGKTLFPRFDTVGEILKRLAVVAALRLLCALLMIFIIAKYVFL